MSNAALSLRIQLQCQMLLCPCEYSYRLENAEFYSVKCCSVLENTAAVANAALSLRIPVKANVVISQWNDEKHDILKCDLHSKHRELFYDLDVGGCDTLNDFLTASAKNTSGSISPTCSVRKKMKEDFFFFFFFFDVACKRQPSK